PRHPNRSPTSWPSDPAATNVSGTCFTVSMEAEAPTELVDPDPGALERAITRILAEEHERNSITSRIDRVAAIRRRQASLAAREMRELAELWELARAELPHNATGTELDHAWRSLAAELAV